MAASDEPPASAPIFARLGGVVNAWLFLVKTTS
jgi:hypothetical protein